MTDYDRMMMFRYARQILYFRYFISIGTLLVTSPLVLLLQYRPMFIAALWLFSGMVLYNLLGHWFLNAASARQDPKLLGWVIFLQFMLDGALFTYLIYVSGGLVSPFTLFLLLPQIGAVIVFVGQVWPPVLLTLAYNTMYIGLLLAQYLRLVSLPYDIPWIIEANTYLLQVLRFAVVFPLLSWLLVFLAIRASNLIRQGRVEIAAQLTKEIDKLKARLGEGNAEERVMESEERFKALFEYAPDPYYITDLRGNLFDANRAAESLLGYAKNEFVGSPLFMVRLLPPFQVPKAAALLVRNTLGQSTGPDEFTLIRQNGTQVEVEISTYPLKFKDQTMVLGIARDLSPRRQAQEESQSHVHEVEILDKIITECNRAENIQSLLVKLLDLSMELLGFEGGAIYLLSAKGDRAELATYKNLPEVFIDKVRSLPANQMPYARIFIERQPIVTEDYEKVNPEIARLGGLHGFASIPLFTKDKVIGSLNLATRLKAVLSKQKLSTLLAIGQEIGAAVSRMQSEEELKKRVLELEKMNKFMMGRELDIINLKKEVNELLLQLKQEARYKV